MGGDFNDIVSNTEKQGGRRRQENSFTKFRDFIADMDMRIIRYKGEPFTWANNKEGEGFIQERLDRFFGSANWMLQWNTSVMTNILTQSSDHSMILLDSKPQ